MKNYREISLKINESLSDVTPETFLNKEIADRLQTLATGFGEDIDRKIVVDANPEKLGALNITAMDDEHGTHGAFGQGVITINGVEYKIDSVNYERYTADDGSDRLRLRNVSFANGESLRFEGKYAFFLGVDKVTDVLLCERVDYPVPTKEKIDELGIVEYDPRNPIYKPEELSDSPVEFKELTSRNSFFETAFDALKTRAVEGRKYDSDELRDSRGAVLDCVSRLPADEITFYGEKFKVNEITTRIDNSICLSESEYRIVIEIADGTFPGYRDRITMSAETKDALKALEGVSLAESDAGIKIEIDTERFVKTDAKGHVELDVDGFSKVMDSVMSALEDYNYLVEKDELVVSYVENKEDLIKTDKVIEEIEKEDLEEYKAIYDLRNSGIEKFEGNFGDGPDKKSEKINKAIVNVETGEFRFVYAYKTEDGIEYFKESENSPTFRLSENWVDVTDCFKGQNMKGGIFKSMERAYKKINAGDGTEFFSPTEIESVSNLMAAADMFISKMSSENSLAAARFMYESISNYVNPIEKFRLANGDGGDSSEDISERLRRLELEGKLVEPTGKTIEQMVKDGTAIEQFLRTGTRVEVAYDALMDFVKIQSKDGGQSSKVGGTPLSQRVWAPITLGTKFIGHLIGNLIWRKFHHLENVVSIRNCFEMAWASAPFLALVDATEYKKNRFSRTPNAIMQLELKKNLVRENDALRVFEKAAGIEYKDLVGVTKEKMSAIEILNETILLERGVGSESKENILDRYKNIDTKKDVLESTINDLEKKIKKLESSDFKKDFETQKKELYKKLESIDKKKDKEKYQKTKEEIEKELESLDPKSKEKELKEAKEELEKTKAELAELKKNKVYEKVEKREAAMKRLRDHVHETKETEDSVSALKAELSALESTKSEGKISDEEYASQKETLEEKLSSARKELSIKRNGREIDNCSDFKELSQKYNSEITEKTTDYQKELISEKIKLVENLAEGTADRPLDKVFGSLKDAISKIEQNDANKAKLEAWKEVLADVGKKLTNSEKAAIAYDIKNELFSSFKDPDISLEYKIGDNYAEKDLISEAIEITEDIISIFDSEKNGDFDGAKAKISEVFGDNSKLEIFKNKVSELESKETLTTGEKKILEIAKSFLELNVDIIFQGIEVGKEKYFESESEILAIALDSSFSALPNKAFDSFIVRATDRITELRNNGSHAEIAKIDSYLDSIKSYEKNESLLLGDKKAGIAGETESIKKVLEGKLKGISPDDFLKELGKLIGAKDDILVIPSEADVAKQKAFIAKNVASEYIDEISRVISELEKLGSTFVSEKAKLAEIAAELKISDVSDVATIVEMLSEQKQEILESKEYRQEEAEISSEQSFIKVIENAKTGKEGKIARLDLIAKAAGLELEFDPEKSRFVPYESSYLSVETIELNTIEENSILNSIEKDLKLAQKVYADEDREVVIPGAETYKDKGLKEIHALFGELLKDGTFDKFDARVNDLLTLCGIVDKNEILLEKQKVMDEKNGHAVERIAGQTFKKKGKLTLQKTAVNVDKENEQLIQNIEKLTAEMKLENLSRIKTILPELKNELLLILQEIENCKAGHLESSSLEVKLLEEKAEDLKQKIIKIEEYKEKFEASLEKAEKIESKPVETTSSRTIEKVVTAFEKFNYKEKDGTEHRGIYFEKTSDPNVYETSDKNFTLAIKGSEPDFEATITVNKETVLEAADSKDIIEDFTKTCELEQIKVLQVENLKHEEFTEVVEAEEKERESSLISDEDKTSLDSTDKDTSTKDSGDEHPEAEVKEEKVDSEKDKPTEEKPEDAKPVEEEKTESKEEKVEEKEKNKAQQKDKLTKAIEKALVEYVCKKRGVKLEGKFKSATKAKYEKMIAESKGIKKFFLELFYKFNVTPFADTVDSFRKIGDLFKSIGHKPDNVEVKFWDILGKHLSTSEESKFYNQFIKGRHLDENGKWVDPVDKTEAKAERIKYLKGQNDVFSKAVGEIMKVTDAKISYEEAKAELDEINTKLETAKPEEKASLEKQKTKLEAKVDRCKQRLENSKKLDELKKGDLEKYFKNNKVLENLTEAGELTDDLVKEKVKLDKLIDSKDSVEKQIKKLDKKIEKTKDTEKKEKLEKKKAELQKKVGELESEINETEGKVESIAQEIDNRVEKALDECEKPIEKTEKVEGEENPEKTTTDTENEPEVKTENPVSEDEPKDAEKEHVAEPDTEHQEDISEVHEDKPVETPVEDETDKVNKDEDAVDDENDVEGKDADKNTEKQNGHQEEGQENKQPSELEQAEGDKMRAESAKKLDETSPNRAVDPKTGDFESADGTSVKQIFEDSTHLTRLEINLPGLDDVKISVNAEVAPGQDGRTARESFHRFTGEQAFDASGIKSTNTEDKVRDILSDVIKSKSVESESHFRERIMFEHNNEGKTLVDVEVKGEDGEVKKKKIKLEDLEDVLFDDEKSASEMLDSLTEESTCDLEGQLKDLIDTAALENQFQGADGADFESQLGDNLEALGPDASAEEVQGAIEAAVSEAGIEVGTEAAAAVIV